jgi:hypothetical protein
MKTIHYFIALAAVSLIISCKSKTGVKPESDTTAVSQVSETEITEPVGIKKYGIKSGIIAFEINMMGNKEKMVLYFDDFGAKEAEEEYEDENVKKINLCDGKNMYTIIPADKAAFTSGSCYRGVAYRFAWDEISEEDQNAKAKKTPKMIVAGKDCESFSYDMGTTSTVYAGWNSICLYQKTKSQYGDVIKQAIRIEENVAIPAAKFQVPADYEIKKSGF